MPAENNKKEQQSSRKARRPLQALTVVSQTQPLLRTTQTSPRLRTLLWEDAENWSEGFRADLKKSLALPLRSVLDLLTTQVLLPPSSKRKTIVLDLDETLVYTKTLEPLETLVRPGALRFLRTLSKYFEVIVFTAAEKHYADSVLDKLDPSNCLVDYRLYRDHCVAVKKTYVKDLRVLANRRLENLTLVDNSCSAFAYQLDNGVPVRAWCGDPSDRELVHLLPYLLTLQYVEDVRVTHRARFRLGPELTRRVYSH